MTPLVSLQAAFQDGVLNAAPGILKAVAGDEARTRFDVYAQAYRLRLHEVLQQDFPGLSAIAGDEDFRQLCDDYLDIQRSRHRNMRWCGAALPGFVARDPRWCERLPLAQMAAFEWDLTLVFDAPDSVSADAERLRHVAPPQWPQLRLQSIPAVRQRLLHWNLADIRTALDSDEAVPALKQLDAPGHWLLWRQQDIVRYRPLAPDEAVLFPQLREGLCFEALCERLVVLHDEETAMARAPALLYRWLVEGCLVASKETQS